MHMMLDNGNIAPWIEPNDDSWKTWLRYNLLLWSTTSNEWYERSIM